MRKRALCHHEVVNLMMGALDHDAHEAERIELHDLARIACGDHQLYTIRQIFGSGLPTERS